MSAPRLAIEALSAISLRANDAPILRRRVAGRRYRRSARPRRRERRRQIDHRQGRPRHHAVAGEGHRRPHCLRGPRSFRAFGERTARRSRPRHRAGAAGSLDRAQSLAADRCADDRWIVLKARAVAEGGAAAGAGLARRGADPRSGARALELSASALRRHAPARAHCRGVRARTETRHCRRADHRARRHRAKADSSAHSRLAGARTAPACCSCPTISASWRKSATG